MKNILHSIKLLKDVIKEFFVFSRVNTIGMVLFMIIISLLPGASTLLTANFLDVANASQTQDTFKTFFLIAFELGVFYMVNDLANNLFNVFMVRMDEKGRHHFDIMLAEKCSKLPLIAYEDASIMDAMRRAQECVGRALPSDTFLQVCNLVVDIIQILSVISVLAVFNIWFVPISLLSVIPYLIIRIYRGKEFYRLRWWQAKRTRGTNYLLDLFKNKSSVVEMRMMGLNSYIEGLWIKSRDELNKEVWEFRKKDLKSLLICDFLKIAGYILSIAFALYLVVNGKISIGQFGACIAAFASVQGTTQWFLISLGRLPEFIAFTRDLFDFLQIDEDKMRKFTFMGLKEKISLKGVSFCYPNTTNPAVENINLDLVLGEKIALVGVNGSGKTTLSKLIMGIYTPSHGHIYVDDQDIDDIDRFSLYKSISMVSQNFTRYNMTLRENIGISNYSSMNNIQRIKDTLGMVGLETLAETNEGVDINIGRDYGGIELSGGQWQKLSISRALFKESDFMILDEPTSALDPLIESEILRSFLKIAEKKTAIIITHRVGICRYVDKVALMQDGSIIEYGTHNQLYERKGEYYNIYNEQQKWYQE